MDEKQVVGTRRRRRDAESTPVVTNWSTDVITNREPGFAYQFFRQDEVSSKLRATRIELKNFETGESQVHDIPGWQVVKRDCGAEEAAGFRPDEGSPLDTALLHGGGGTQHVCMKIQQKYKDLMDRRDEQRAEAYEQRLSGGELARTLWATEPLERMREGGVRINRHEQFVREGR